MVLATLSLSILLSTSSTDAPQPAADGSVAATLAPCRHLMERDGSVPLDAGSLDVGFNAVCAVTPSAYLGATVDASGAIVSMSLVDEALGTATDITDTPDTPAECISHTTECGILIELCAQWDGLFNARAWILVCDTKTNECHSASIGAESC